MALTLREIVQVSRPISWFNTAFPFAGGAFYTGVPLSTPRNLLGIAYFTLPYNLALYGINDICDYPSDRLNPRKNSIEGGLLPPDTHQRMISLITGLNLPFLALLIAQGNRRANTVLGVLLFTTFAYSAPPLRYKEIPFLDAFTSATHFVTPYLYGLVFNQTKRYPKRELLGYTAWCMASQAFGAIQDIPFDQSVGSQSIATVLGPRKTAQFSTVLYLLTSVLALLGQGNRGARRLAALAILPYALNTALYLRDPQPALANRYWRRFIWLNLITGAIYTNLLLWQKLQTKRSTKKDRA